MLTCRPPIPGGVSPHLLLICCEKHAISKGLPNPFASPLPQLDLVIRGVKVCRGLQDHNITSLGGNCLLPHQFFTSSKAYGNPMPHNTNSSCYEQCVAPVSPAFFDQGKSPHQHPVVIPVSTSAFKILHWIIAITGDQLAINC